MHGKMEKLRVLCLIWFMTFMRVNLQKKLIIIDKLAMSISKVDFQYMHCFKFDYAIACDTSVVQYFW